MRKFTLKMVFDVALNPLFDPTKNTSIVLSFLPVSMISKATERDHLAIIELWEGSIRASHHFLPEDYLQEIKSLLPSILNEVPLFIHIQDKMITGFLGVAEQKIEMLFIHASRIGQGIGRQLTEFAIQKLGATKVDVNEQNEAAFGFYKKMGFSVKGRSELDTQGRPFPLLHMEIL